VRKGTVDILDIRREIGEKVMEIKILPFSTAVFYLGEGSAAAPVSWHRVKSISRPQPLQTWVLSNSSEKISASFPQSGQ
jgi:hypothetical protein